MNKFLIGLRPDYDVFFATFHLTRSFILWVVSDSQRVIVTITFDKAVMAARKEKQRINQLEEPNTALFSSTPNHSGENQATVILLFCTHYHKNYHVTADCWDLHSKTRKKADKKRRANYDKKQAKKQRKNSFEDDDT